MQKNSILTQVLCTLVVLAWLPPVRAKESRALTPKQAQVGRSIPLRMPRADKYERKRVKWSKTPLPNGMTVLLRHWQWTIPGKPRLSQKIIKHRRLGWADVTRVYTPEQDKTVVDQAEVLTMLKKPKVLVSPQVQQQSEAQKAAMALDFVTRMVRERYVEPVKDEKLIRDMIKGIGQGLDPHSTYFTPEQWQQMQKMFSGNYVGIGIMLQQKPVKGTDKTQVIVGKAKPGFPAFRAGLRKGDRILKVDGKPVTTNQEVVNALLGPAKTQATVEVQRGDQVLTFQPERKKIESNPIAKTRLTKDGIGYIRLSEFGRNSASGIQSSIARLKQRLAKRADGNKELRGLVLDLRNNPGGFVDQAVTILDDFVKEGTLVSTRGRDNKVLETYSANPFLTAFADLKLAVLVNGNSASASEIVSGTLRDLGRATVIGEKTYGKGTVQSSHALPDGSGFKMTFARYFTAGGTTPAEQKVEPHITTNAAKQNFKARHPNSRRKIVDYALEEALHVLRHQPNVMIAEQASNPPPALTRPKALIALPPPR